MKIEFNDQTLTLRIQHGKGRKWDVYQYDDVVTAWREYLAVVRFWSARVEEVYV